MNPFKPEIGEQEEYFVRMPDENRMRQRLGQLSLNQSTKQAVFPLLFAREREQFSYENFVGVIDEAVESAASIEPDINQDAVREKMPRLIMLLLDKEKDKREALSVWFTKQHLEATNGNGVSSQAIKGAAKLLIAVQVEKELQGDLPRKQKAKLSAAERSKHIRPHTSMNDSKNRRRQH